MTGPYQAHRIAEAHAEELSVWTNAIVVQQSMNSPLHFRRMGDLPNLSDSKWHCNACGRVDLANTLLN